MRALTKSGELDAAIAVQQELNAVKGTPGNVSGGKVTPELTALKSKYESEVQMASEALQVRYVKALETLQETYTKRGNLDAAVAVRQEVTNTRTGQLSSFLSDTKWLAHPEGGFIKEITFTKDGKLVRTDSNNQTYQVAYQLGSDGDSVSYKKSDGKEVTLRFSRDRLNFSAGSQTFKQLPKQSP